MRAAPLSADTCVLCNGGEQPFALNARGDLVCRAGSGCQRRARRSPTVQSSRIPGPKPPPVPTARASEACACGTAAEWMELRGRALVGCCVRCVPGGPLR